MSLRDSLQSDMKNALRSGDKDRLSVIRLVLAAVKNAEIDAGHPLTDEEILALISREVKQRKEVLPDYEKSGRSDLVEKLTREINILLGYLPPQLSEDELRRIIRETAAEIGPIGPKEMGKLMGALMPKVKGRADGKLVQTLVKEFLSE